MRILTIVLFVGMLGSIVGLSACSNVAGEGKAESKGGGTIAQSAASEPTIVHRASSADASSAPGPVFSESKSVASLTFTPTGYAGLLKDKDLELVLRGTVSKVEYRHDVVGTTYTLVTLDIDQVIRGEAAETVTYMELGGYIKAADLAKINGPKEGVPSMPEDGWIDSKFLGAPHSKIGDEQVVFLQKSKVDEYEYLLLQGPFGRYTWTPDAKVWTTFAADTIKDPTMTDQTVLALR